MDKLEYIIEKFNNGMNCSQCIISAYSEELGIDKGLAVILKRKMDQLDVRTY